jgi:hypothetical protein
VLADIKPWRYPATRDVLYGEWLRTDYEAGRLPRREADPNLPVILTSARQHSSVLLGPPGDERNVLLTLARILFTLRTGRIAPKDVAAAEVCSTLAPAHAQALDRAARAYCGEIRDDWTELRDEASAAATALTDRIDALRP